MKSERKQRKNDANRNETGRPNSNVFASLPYDDQRRSGQKRLEFGVAFFVFSDQKNRLKNEKRGPRAGFGIGSRRKKFRPVGTFFVTPLMRNAGNAQCLASSGEGSSCAPFCETRTLGAEPVLGTNIALGTTCGENELFFRIAAENTISVSATRMGAYCGPL